MKTRHFLSTLLFGAAAAFGLIAAGALDISVEWKANEAHAIDLFGSDLEALTSQTHHMPSASTYFSRSTEFVDAPGALVRRLPFTL